MSALKTPAPDAHASEWGALAVSIPGWRWVPGMLGYNDYGGNDRIMDRSEASQQNSDLTPDPDDDATAGCLEALLGGPVPTHLAVMADPVASNLWHHGRAGRARIAAAAALGRWPGGAE